MSTPRFHGDGRADWDVLVSITFRDWAAMEEHSDAEIAARLYPGPGDVQGARRPVGSSCSRRTGTSRWSGARSTRQPGLGLRGCGLPLRPARPPHRPSPGIAPSCCIIFIWSNWCQCSTTLPSRIRKMWISPIS